MLSKARSEEVRRFGTTINCFSLQFLEITRVTINNEILSDSFYSSNLFFSACSWDNSPTIDGFEMKLPLSQGVRQKSGFRRFYLMKNTMYIRNVKC